MNPLPDPEIECALRDVLGSEPGVVLAYLFGSVARGTAGPLSDIDVGVVLCDGGDPREILGRLTDLIVLRLSTDRVDVVSLLAAPMPLRYRAVRDGRVLLCRDPLTRERFEVETIRQYLDFKPLRDRALATVRDMILKAG